MPGEFRWESKDKTLISDWADVAAICELCPNLEWLSLSRSLWSEKPFALGRTRLKACPKVLPPAAGRPTSASPKTSFALEMAWPRYLREPGVEALCVQSAHADPQRH